MRCNLPDRCLTYSQGGLPLDQPPAPLRPGPRHRRTPPFPAASRQSCLGIPDIVHLPASCRSAHPHPARPGRRSFCTRVCEVRNPLRAFVDVGHPCCSDPQHKLGRSLRHFLSEADTSVAAGNDTGASRARRRRIHRAAQTSRYRVAAPAPATAWRNGTTTRHA